MVGERGLGVAYYLVVATVLGNIVYVRYVREDTPAAPQHHHNLLNNPQETYKRPQEAANNKHSQTIKHTHRPTYTRKRAPAIKHIMYPLIFVGGHPRSGTTLLRSMLDAHGDVHCGEETHIVPRVAMFWHSLTNTSGNHHRMSQAGFTLEVMDRAVAKFLLRVIIKDGSGATRLCNKDPFVMLTAVYLHRLFPKSKFIFVIRDGRAVIHSVISRGVSIMGFNAASEEESLRTWSVATSSMYQQCEQLGPTSCLPVFYEQLIIHPRQVMRAVLKFLDLPWRASVLQHQKFIGRENGRISLNPLEKSTSQVQQARYTEALTSWVGRLPFHFLQDMNVLAPMLAVLGYDPHANPPQYHKLTYTWGQKPLNMTSADRHSVRRFFSALYHRANANTKPIH
ncbi:protein-tyrosine sulfotransferase 1-like isoform X2 [Cherax quadricarinatus]|uniref:protein-tyrosine sulfotransferase 1-like isoform X2 n=1 Tax=Cherax quadricarinatus TaxID=27406 RepID=UPI00387ED838